MLPLISVIVPCYKVEKYLPKCVDSILTQTYNNLEILLVDDGSPDQCGHICDEYAKIDGRIKIIHKLNGGLSDARNVAIDVATGEYIAFVDSDDYVANNYIETLYKLTQKYEAKISIVNPLCVDEDGNINHIFDGDGIEYIWHSKEAVEHMFYQELFDTSAWGKLYHRSLFDNGIRYPKSLCWEDLPTTYRLFLETDKIAFKNIELYFYLLRNDSIEGTTFTPSKIESAIKIFNMFQENKGILNSIESSIRCRLFSFAFHITMKMPSDYNKKEFFYSFIRRNRFKILIDPKSRNKAKLAAILSYMGIGITRKAFSLIKTRN